MKTQNYLAILTTLGLSALCLPNLEAKGKDRKQPVVQIALLLDTSNSMDGLINQAKSQLWGVVNEFIHAEQGGKTPVVQVALYEYGNNSLQEETRWVRRVLPLTRDLDTVSEKLFALTTNGGKEYCGTVIERAIKDLDWDASSKTYKAIFIAGNEPFTQGPVNPKKACRLAIGDGVVVNTIHCGPIGQGIEGGWKQGAMLAEGSYLAIDQDKAVAHVDAPQDKKIAELNIQLNNTYIVYGGVEAQQSKANQVAQDGNALRYQSLASRVVCKASSNYANHAWDLVDASKEKDFDLAKVKKDELPEEMKGMSVKEQEAYVKGKAAERERIQKQILSLNEGREKYVVEKLKEQGNDDTVGAAMVKAIRSQAGTRGITFN